MSNTSYGLGVLMEAMKQSEAAEAALEAETNLMDDVADDEVKRLIIGDDSVENDMDGHGLSEEKKKRLEEFIDKIPRTTTDKLDDTEIVENMMVALEECTQDLKEMEV